MVFILFSLFLLFCVYTRYIESASLLNVTLLRQFEDCLRNLTHVPNHTPLWQQPQCSDLKQDDDYCNLGLGLIGDGNAAAGGEVWGSAGGYKCRTRGIDERPTLHQGCTAECMEARHKTLIRFMQGMKRYGYTSLYFIGDSVTVQLAHFVGCDFLRGGDGVIKLSEAGCPPERDRTPSKPLYDAARKAGCSVISHYESGTGGAEVLLHRLVVRTMRKDPPCNGGKCHDRRAVRELYEQWFAGPAFERVWRNTLIVFNSGLHIESYDTAILSHISSAMAIGMLELAPVYARLGSSIIFRETSAQHFAYSVDGHYQSNQSVLAVMNPSESESSDDSISACCADTTRGSTRTLGRADEFLQADLARFKPDWRRLVGWAKFYEHSKAIGADLHIEHGDCTHFVYDPVGAPEGGSLSMYLLESVLQSVQDLRRHRK